MNRNMFAKNEKDLENLIKAVKIYNEDRGMEFGIKICVILRMKYGKQLMTERTELPNQEKTERFEKGKLTNTWEY